MGLGSPQVVSNYPFNKWNYIIWKWLLVVLFVCKYDENMKNVSEYLSVRVSEGVWHLEKKKTFKDDVEKYYDDLRLILWNTLWIYLCVLYNISKSTVYLGLQFLESFCLL